MPSRTRQTDPPKDERRRRGLPVLERVRRSPLAHAVGGLIVLVGLLPSFVDFPVVSRWDGWAVIAVAAAFLLTAALTTSVRVVALSTAVTTTAAVLALVFAPLPDFSGDGTSGASPRPSRGAVTVTRVGSQPLAMASASGRSWVLHRDGTVIGVGAQLPQVTFRVPGPAAGIAVCAEALVITYGRGYVGRFSLRTHRRLAHYRYGYGSNAVACGGGFIWLIKQLGSIVQLDERRLTLVDEFPVGGELSSVAYANGAVWASDIDGDRVVGVEAGPRHRLLGPLAVMPDAQQLVASEGRIWVLHRQQSCLLRLDIARGTEAGPGIALGTYPSAMRAVDDIMYIVDYSDRTVARIDLTSGQPIGRPIRIPSATRLVDVDERGGRVALVDRAAGSLITLNRHAWTTLTHLPSKSARSKGCLST